MSSILNTLIAKTCLGLAACLTLSSCGTTGAAKHLVDPAFATYEPLVENNAPRNAILGMWHRADTMNFGLPGASSTTRLWTSLLFRSDGTCLSTGKLKSETGTTELPATTHRWHYLGGGKWAPQAATAAASNATNWYRLAGDKLLSYSDTPHGNIRHVYSRVR